MGVRLVRSPRTVMVIASTGMIVALVAGAVPARATFPGVNGKIVFGRANAPGAVSFNEIYVMNPDGSNQTALTPPPVENDSARWSPDGSRLAFDSLRDGNFEIYVMNADGSNPTRLTTDPGADIQPSWSPDGSKIVFMSNRDINHQIYVMNADGSGHVNRSMNSFNESQPAWSPEGSKIAFVSDRPPGGFGANDIYIMNPDGSDQTRLTSSTGDDLFASWSPDGSKLAFTSHRDGHYQVYVMNADGSGQVNRSMNSFNEVQPAWSPDGSKIAFASDRPPALPTMHDIYVMNADGSAETRLTTDPAGEGGPDWQPLPPPDTTPPTVTCVGMPGILWPPNHQLRQIAAAVTVTDTDSGPAGFVLTAVSSSQPDAGPGYGVTRDDVQGWTLGTADTSGLLRAERYRGARTYTLTYEGRDVAGNTATCSAAVVVPHDSHS
jgi:Tol biopolymer transport system component